MNLFKRPKPTVSHTSFSILFITVLFVFSNLINMDKLTIWFHRADAIDYSGLGAYLIFALGICIATFILIAHRWTIKPAAILLVVMSAMATYFIAKYNVAVDRSMIMNTIHTDVSEVTGLLSIQMIPYFLFLVLLPVLIIVKVNISFSRPLKYLSASLILFIISLSLATGMLYLQYNSIHRAGNLSNKYIIHSLVPLNIMVSSASGIHRSIQAYNRRHKKPVVITGRVTEPGNLVVVLVIGESSRQKSFSLYGYDGQETNPVLSKIPGLTTLNGIARVGSTLLALPEILEKKEVKLPAITSKLGIDTACYVNYTLYDNCDAVGEIKVSDCAHEGKCYDEDVIPLLEKNLESYVSGYRMVVLHLGGGSHGPKYRDRYPPEFQRFNPQCLEADLVNYCSIEQIYNSYDNTILYVDYVLGKIIGKLDASKAPYVFIYLSDHGESLLENDRIFHGMPPGIPLPAEQAQVPLIVKSSIPISIVQRDEYSQQSVYDTVLALFSIETDILDKDSVFLKIIPPGGS
ncbi:MAG: lipid A ethanolaminephosphotransferase [Planctomycetota bacterium]|jgi:lipid A ethanolaminephosphotransferase